MKYITTKMLECLDACDPGLDAFRKEFPSGRATWAKCVTMASKSNDYARYVAWIGRYCPAGVNGATWDARKALQRNYRDRAWLRQVCPDGVAGATFEARMAVQQDDWGRRLVRVKFGKKGAE